jgi:hypothetical protein
MTWILIIVWCQGYQAASCTPVAVPPAYVSEESCKTAGERAVQQTFTRYFCVWHD